MPDLSSLINQLPINDIATRLGTDPGTAKNAIAAALPAILGGMQANAADPAGNASLNQAISQHSGSLVNGGVDIDQVDTNDGEAITRHVFGNNTDAVINALGASGGSGVTDSLMRKLLPMLAPIVMSYLASQLFGGAGSARTATNAAPAGGGLNDILGQVLGGAMGGGSSAAANSGGGLTGSIVSEVLGGLLGGGRR